MYVRDLVAVVPVVVLELMEGLLAVGERFRIEVCHRGNGRLRVVAVAG